MATTEASKNATPRVVKKNGRPAFVVDSNGVRHRIIRLPIPGSKDQLWSFAFVAWKLAITIETLEARQRGGWFGQGSLRVINREVLEPDSLGRTRTKMRFLLASDVRRVSAARPGETAERFRDGKGKWVLIQSAAAFALLGQWPNARFNNLCKKHKLRRIRMRSTITGRHVIAFLESAVIRTKKQHDSELKTARSANRDDVDEDQPILPAPDSTFCTTSEAERISGANRQLLGRMKKRGELRSSGSGRQKRWRRKEMEALAQTRASSPPGRGLLEAAEHFGVSWHILSSAAMNDDPVLKAAKVPSPGIRGYQWRVTDDNVRLWLETREVKLPKGWLTHQDIVAKLPKPSFQACQHLHVQLRDARKNCAEGN